ncbi:hypothetical protein MTO96_018112 [Rhipicephalus appendiculatus]
MATCFTRRQSSNVLLLLEHAEAEVIREGQEERLDRLFRERLRKADKAMRRFLSTLGAPEAGYVHPPPRSHSDGFFFTRRRRPQRR